MANNFLQEQIGLPVSTVLGRRYCCWCKKRLSRYNKKQFCHACVDDAIENYFRMVSTGEFQYQWKEKYGKYDSRRKVKV